MVVIFRALDPPPAAAVLFLTAAGGFSSDVINTTVTNFAHSADTFTLLQQHSIGMWPTLKKGVNFNGTHVISHAQRSCSSTTTST
jgi:hypothetical protein